MPLATKAILLWTFEEHMVRPIIAAIFKQGFLEEIQAYPQVRGPTKLNLRSDVIGRDIDIGNLRFHVSPHVPRTVGRDFHDVMLTRTDLPVGDPRRQRKFRYLPGFHGGVESVIEWPPYPLTNR